MSIYDSRQCDGCTQWFDPLVMWAVFQDEAYFEVCSTCAETFPFDRRRPLVTMLRRIRAAVSG